MTVAGPNIAGNTTSLPPPGVRVGVFGYLKYGNFGDDLMAYMVVKSLKNWGCDVTLYGGNADLASECETKHTDNLARLVENADCVVYSGGGAFLNGMSNRGSCRYDFEQDIDRLCHLCEQKGIPIYMISVGGDGSNGLNSKIRMKLLLNAKGITFRNAEDFAIAQKRNENPRIYEDIVWLTPLFFPIKQPATPPKETVIGIDLTSLRGRADWLLIRGLSTLLSIPLFSTSILFLNHHKKHNMPQAGNVACYRSVKEYVARLRKLDVVLTHRLHAGMVAMAFGSRVIQYRPTPKAQLLFKRLGMESQIIPTKWGLAAALISLLWRGKGSSLRSETSIDLRNLQESAKCHLRSLEAWICDVAQTKTARPTT